MTTPSTGETRPKSGKTTREDSPLYTVYDVAALLKVGRGTIYRLLQGRDYDEKIALGQKTLNDVPQPVRGYLNKGFPPVYHMLPGCPRFKKADIDAWMTRHFGEIEGRDHG